MSSNDDQIFNNSSNPHFQDVLKEALKDPSRRNILRGGLGLTAMFALPMLPGCGGVDAPSVASLPASTLLGFNAVTKSILDQVVVPAGYTVKVLHATGDRLNTTVTQYSNLGLETDDWTQRVGDHHDGMDIFYIDSNGRYSTKATNKAVLAVNHESSADSHFLHPKGQTSGGVNGKKFSQFGEWDVKARPGLEVLKEINLHGISVAEITLDSAGKPTGYVLDSALNRRITPQTLADVRGPAAHLSAIRTMFVTRFDTTGATSRGTLNNCGHGITPWGTYLGCEENWAVYFNMPTGATLPDAKTIASRRRYGVSNAILASTATAGTGQGWYTPTDLEDTDFRFTRWNVAAIGASAAADFRNEPHTFGYNLELDPLNPTARPAKRTAMGTMARPAVSSAPSIKLRPNAIKPKPPKSKGTGSTAGGSSRTKASVSAIANSPKGMLTKKIQRQLAKVTMAPPNKGPIMRPMTGGTVNQTMAATMPSGGTARNRIRRPTGTIMAPPIPCRIRNTTSSGRLLAKPHRVEASENSAIAIQNTRRAPSRSASQPLSGRNTARLSR